MNKILELDPKTGSVAFQPGLNYGKLQQTLKTHGRFLPPFPASMEYCTLGGAMGNNAAGQNSVKYGSTRDFVRGLRVVLANGEVIETGRLNKRDLSKKMGQNSMEGMIYRELDKLIEEHKDAVAATKLDVSKNSAGYDMSDVKQKDGSFDLTPLIIGSQGTLGIITEAVIDTEAYNPATTLLVASFDDVERSAKAILDIRKLSDVPSAMEMVDGNLLNFIDEHNPNQLKGTIEKPFHKIMLLVEFDNFNPRLQKRMAKKTKKIIEDYGGSCQTETDPEKQDHLWRIRHSAASVTAYSDNNSKALPIIEDGIVPVEKFVEYLSGAYSIFEKYGLQVAVWGHAGNANLHMQPFLDLGQLGDRQKLFRIMEEYHQLVMSLGGSTTGEHGDGRLRAPYLRQLFGEEVYELFVATKKIFDPYNTMNPGVKVGVTLDDLKPMLRQEYSMKHLYDHMPRT
jgi:FAD/FMN-containing dehydrogenase